MSEQQQNSPVRSLQSRYKLKVSFTNTSERAVDLYWLDFRGNRVRYQQNFQPSRTVQMLTYVTHPWVAHDSVTGQKMLMSGQPVFTPFLPPELGRGEGVGDEGRANQQLADAEIQAALRAMPPIQINIHIPGTV
jgi:hypothetical protein